MSIYDELNNISNRDHATIADDNDDETISEEEYLRGYALVMMMYGVIMVLIATIVVLFVTLSKQEVEVPMQSIKEDVAVVEEPPMWDYLIQALIIVESEGNPNAVGKTNDVGILQITPIYVEEVNRIIDTPKYNLEMRKSVEYSLEMFEIYQAHHNPDKDIIRAIKLHNPGAGRWYTDKVMNQLNKLIQS